MSLANQRVVVMGLGRFGGGVGVTRYLAAQHARVLVTDTSPPDTLRDSVAQLRGLNVEYRLGEHRIEDFTSADLIVVNPAVDARANPFLQAARDAGVALTTEMRLLVERLPHGTRTLGVTGTAGKSTTVAMIGHVLRNAAKYRENEPAGGDDAPRRDDRPRVWVGGNIGGSLLLSLDQMRDDDVIVLELSSFMLDWLDEARWSPHTAVVTNLSPNHIDRHGDFDAYVKAKQAILNHQQPGDRAVLGSGAAALLKTRASDVTVVSDQHALDPIATLKLPGRHNLFNAHLALAACGDLIARDEAAAALATFAGLTHRMQLVCEFNDVRFFNDSKATTPDATYLALTSFPHNTIHLIIGGYDKGIDLKPLTAFASQHCRAIYTIGQTGESIAEIADFGDAEVVRCGDLNRAVEEAVARLRRDDVVLLSPACASYGQFTNFEERGTKFVEAVLRCTGEGARVPA